MTCAAAGAAGDPVVSFDLRAHPGMTELRKAPDDCVCLVLRGATTEVDELRGRTVTKGQRLARLSRADMSR
jgi:hypothetical protein